MKNKLNNKGFAVTTVVYAILLLLIILMFTILVLYRNTYRNQKQFSADVQDELNEYLVDQTPPDTNPPECFLTSVKNADGTYTLTISAGNSPDIDLEEGYSFDGINYSNVKTKNISKEDCVSGICEYKGHTKDADGNKNDEEKYPCEVVVSFDIIPPTCTLTASGSGESVTLTVSSTDEDIATDGYAFTNPTNFSSTTTKKVTTAGTYNAYVKDKSGNISTACSHFVTEHFATFKRKSTYSSYISSPSDGATDSCLVSIGGSCNITAPEITLNTSGSNLYGSYSRGWGTSSTATTITYEAGDSITLSGDKTFYTVFKKNGGSLDDGGGSSSGCGECTYRPRSEGESVGQCVDGKRPVTKCVKDTSWGNGAVCQRDSNGNPTAYYGKYEIVEYRDC